jgi:hypothetical protein
MVLWELHDAMKILGVIGICKSKDRQQNGQRKMDKKTNNKLPKYYTN